MNEFPEEFEESQHLYTIYWHFPKFQFSEVFSLKSVKSVSCEVQNIPVNLNIKIQPNIF